jgi:putative phosphoribosyl transferase
VAARFANRVDAGRRLAAELEHLRGEPCVVLGLPRGGVPVAAEVARALDAPLDVIVVRKLGVPRQPELGMGAIGEDGVRVMNDEIVHAAGVSGDQIARVEASERIELDRRARRFRGDRERVPLDGRTAIVVDDGVATGSTALAACRIAAAHGARRVVLAVPVAPVDWTSRLGGAADELVALSTPRFFHAIGQFYDDFSQTSDDEVVRCLERAARRTATTPEPARPEGLRPRDDDVRLPIGDVTLDGHLSAPEHAAGTVVFAHGSGSSRHSPRNQFVAGVLNEAGLATLLFDLLTRSEERDRTNVFDVGLLADRLIAVTGWLRRQPGLDRLPVGYFGASTGAAAALSAAAAAPHDVDAVVSRGGRPDLAGAALGSVRAPTLLIVGGDDRVVLDLNRRAQAQLRTESELRVIPGATHLFEEPGALEAAAAAARNWFVDHLGGDRRRDDD